MRCMWNDKQIEKKEEKNNATHQFVHNHNFQNLRQVRNWPKLLVFPSIFCLFNSSKQRKSSNPNELKEANLCNNSSQTQLAP